MNNSLTQIFRWKDGEVHGARVSRILCIVSALYEEKAKVAASTEVAERVANLTSECAAKTANLQEGDEHLWQEELKC